MARLRKINGRYYAYFYNREWDPKEVSYPLRVTRKEPALKKMKRLEDELAEGRFDPRTAKRTDLNAPTIKEAKESFLADRSHLSPKTIDTYDEVLRGLIEVLPPSILIKQITPEDLASYVITPKRRRADGSDPDNTELSVATKRKRYRHLRTFFKWAVDSRLIRENPLKDIEPPKKQQKLPQYLTPKELERVIITMESDAEIKASEPARTPRVGWLRDAVLLAVGTGMRLGEVVSLRWSQVDLETNWLTTRTTNNFRTKSGHDRRIPLVGDALKVVQRLSAERTDDLDGPVLQKPEGGPIDYEYTSKRFKHYLRMAKLPENIKFHSLRHTCASWLVMKGVSLSVVQQILGHSTVSVTEQYAHLAPDVMTKAMETAFGR